VVTQAKISGRKRRTRIRDQQNGRRSQKGDLPSTILWKQELHMDGHPEINSLLKTYLFGLQIQVQQLRGNRLLEEDITVVMGNGNEEKETTIGTVKGNAINKNGNLQGSIDLSGVIYSKNGRYNLLSVTKIMNSVWKLEGDLKSMYTQQEEFCCSKD
jgi:hypothetical protein